ncbi:hypothetical protein GCM10027053_47520 [Intrasporangium mesophilum]
MAYLTVTEALAAGWSLANRELSTPESILRKSPMSDPTVTEWSRKFDSKATYKKLSDNLENWSRLGVVRST